jgi:hypothetical protein
VIARGISFPVPSLQRATTLLMDRDCRRKCVLRQLFCGTCRNAVPRFTLSQTKGGRRGGKGEVVATDQRCRIQQLMNTVQNKDNATRQMNDNSSGAFLQVRRGCCRGCWRKCYRGHGRRSWDSGKTNSMTEASARGGSFHFPPA